MSEQGRIRTNKVSLWLLDEELALLKKNSFEYNLSQSDYLRMLIVYGRMTGTRCLLDKETAEKLAFEISKIGTNINQITYNTNVKGFAANPDWKELRDNYYKLLDLLGELPFLDNERKEEWQQQVSMLLRKQ